MTTEEYPEVFHGYEEVEVDMGANDTTDETPAVPETDIVEDLPEEEETRTEAQIAIEEIEQSDVSVIVGDQYQYTQYFWHQGVKISLTSSRALAKIQSVYVRPDAFEHALLELRRHRLIHLVGQNHMGKFAMAQALAQELTHVEQESTTDLSIRTLRCTEVASILDLLEDPECPRDSILVMRQAFWIPGLDPMEFRRNLSALLEILVRNNQYLILTSDEEVVSANEIIEAYTVRVECPTSVALREALDQHLNWYGVPEDWHSVATDVASQYLALPYQIDLFALRLAKRTSRPEREELELLIKSIADAEQNARSWFSELDSNEKYYAMLARLCTELPYDQLWDVYVRVIAELRRGGISLKAPLSYGRDDLFGAIQAHISDAGAVEFSNPIYAEIALDQVLGNYRQQFRYLLPTFERIVVESAENTPNNRNLRISLATAVGSLGQAEFDWIKPVLRTWGQHSQDRVRTAVAHALRQVCTNNVFYQPVQYLLQGWRSNRSSSLRWSAAAAYERLHIYFDDHVVRALEGMANDAHGAVRGAVAHAVAAIFRREPDDMLNVLTAWHDLENPYVDRTVASAITRIARDKRQAQRHFRTVESRLRILPLIGQTLVTGSDHQFEAGMELLAEWMEDHRVPDIVSDIEEEIVAAAERSGDQGRKRILDQIAQWIADRDNRPDLYRSALAIRDQIETLPLSVSSDIDLAPFFEEDVDGFEIHDVTTEEDTDFQIDSIR